MEEDDGAAGIPEWVVTFGDMMSLLLTFFIMLVSMSEIKQEQTFQAMVESMRRRFGHDATMAALAPGSNKPRSTALVDLAMMGRAKRADTKSGGDKVKAPVGDNPRVMIVRPGDQQIVGGVVFFAEESDELTEDAKQQLQIAVQEIGGKPQKIEVRGHTSRRPVGKDGAFRDNWDLAYARCRATIEFMLSVGIEKERLRMSIAADNEPRFSGIDTVQRARNARVEVFMINERVSDLNGEDGPQAPALGPQGG